MRVLLDECVPRSSRRFIGGHEVATVPEMGWSGVKNGELLRKMAISGFEAFVTVDQNLAFQQNLRGHPIAIFLLRASANRMEALRPLAAPLRTALSQARPGTLMVIGP